MKSSRRAFILETGALLGGGAVAPAVIGQTSLNDVPPLALPEPPEIRASAGLLSTEMRMASSIVDIGPRAGARREMTVDTYQVGERPAGIPGATLRMHQGDRLDIRLQNDMAPRGIPTNGALPPSYRNASNGHPSLLERQVFTNLHTHGFQVSPKDPGDNVFITVKPGQCHQYSYQLSADQPTGLHWYHPHFHSATTHQAWQGLAGGIVVAGEIDEIPEIKAAKERTIVLNALWVGPNNEVPTALVTPVAGWSPFATVPAVPTDILFTMNGVYQPETTIAPGEVQRWRILGAAPHRFFWIHVEGHVMHQIGQDGVPFAYPRPRPRAMLATGNRAEVLIKGAEPGVYRIWAEAYDQGHPGGPRPRRLLGFLRVAGKKRDDRMPQRLVQPPVMPGPVVRRRQLVFSGDVSGRTGPGVKFYIDGKMFDAGRVDQCVQAGTVEEWELINRDVFQHPFHIHVNPFQVVDVQGAPAGDPTWAYTDPSIWWDVFRLPPRGKVTIRIYFRPEFTGLTVYHCHILPHEDNGMMGSVLIVDEGEACTATAQAAPDCAGQGGAA